MTMIVKPPWKAGSFPEIHVKYQWAPTRRAELELSSNIPSSIHPTSYTLQAQELDKMQPRLALLTTLLLALAFCTVDAKKCKCRVGTPQGTYCGTCPQLETAISAHVYECNPRGGCYDYGYRKSCARKNHSDGLACPIYVWV